MEVAVIGGTGFVGRHIVRALAQAGHRPIVVARHRGDVGALEFRAADLTRPETLDGVLAGCDAVVSAAGSLRQTRAQTFHDIHSRGVRNLIEACRAQKVRRLVHLSSLGARPSSRSIFHRTKYLGEDVVRHSLLDATVLRPAPVFGPGDDFVVPLATMLRRLPVAPLPGSGRARLQPIAVSDVAAAVKGAIDSAATVGQAYDLPGPEVLTIAEIYDRLMTALSLRRYKIKVPYLIIEPAALLLRHAPGVPFPFDHLGIVEEEQPGDPRPAVQALSLHLQPFDTSSLRAALGTHSPP